MYYKLTFLVLVLFIASCKKEETPEPAIQYDIYVNDWNPDMVVSTSVFPLDINGNGQTDFSFQAIETTQWYDSLGYDVYFKFRYEGIIPMDTTFKIALFKDTLNFNLFGNNEMINTSANWGSSAILYEKGWWDHSNSNSFVERYSSPFEVNNGEGYLALKREVNGDVYYGWIHLNVQPDQVTFYESGFNQIPNVPIRIGQTE